MPEGGKQCALCGCRIWILRAAPASCTSDTAGSTAASSAHGLQAASRRNFICRANPYQSQREYIKPSR